MDKPIDLRSDTVTRPTPEMLTAITTAEVGDDVFGDDPTINALQEYAADLLGKESGLFVPTGSMGNQVSLGALARPGDEIVCEANAHFLHYEGGSVGAHLGLMMRPLPGEAGVITADQVASTIRQGSEHNPRTAVVAMENTHNAAGGRIFPIDEARAVAKVARDRGVSLHMDGARLFNAQAATGTSAAEWASCADTVTFCFSKGLGAPVGSMVVGPADVLVESHRLRKRLGGGMRQAGVLAAAARVALETGPARLHEDHANARRLGEALADMNQDAVELEAIDTNMVYVDVGVFGTTGAQVSEALRREGVLTLGSEAPVMRLVTHRDVSSDDTETAILALRKVLV